jgi:plasmid stability protein
MPSATTAITIRKIPLEVHRALKLRAVKNGISVEAEVRAILNQAVRPANQPNIGAELAKIGERFAKELAEIDFDALRDKTPARWPDFG